MSSRPHIFKTYRAILFKIQVVVEISGYLSNAVKLLDNMLRDLYDAQLSEPMEASRVGMIFYLN